MARLSKYFTPTLAASDKERVLEITGIKKTVFQLIEKTELNTLMIQNWSESGSLTQISDLSPAEQNGTRAPINVPQVSVSYLAASTTTLETGVQLGVFEQILPYPYNLFFGEKRPDYEIRLAPDDFVSKLEALRAATHKLESELSKFELSVLWFRGSNCSLPLLFHFVRKKLIRVGTLATLTQLTEKFERQQLIPSDLRQFFGTNAAFFELNFNNLDRSSSPFDSLRAAIFSSLNVPYSKVLGESIVTPESPVLRDFEL
jgi:hypothetical protein